MKLLRHWLVPTVASATLTLAGIAPALAQTGSQQDPRTCQSGECYDWNYETSGTPATGDEWTDNSGSWQIEDRSKCIENIQSHPRVYTYSGTTTKDWKWMVAKCPSSHWNIDKGAMRWREPGRSWSGWVNYWTAGPNQPDYGGGESAL